MTEEKRPTTRRGFLVGLLAGVGAIAAVGGGAKKAEASLKVGSKEIPSSVLYRRTRETERYYKTLYY